MIKKTDYRLKGNFKYFEELEYERQIKVYERELKSIRNEEARAMLDFIGGDIADYIIAKYAQNIETPYDLEDLININLEAEVAEVILNLEHLERFEAYTTKEHLTLLNEIFETKPELLYITTSTSLLIDIFAFLTLNIGLVKNK